MPEARSSCSTSASPRLLDDGRRDTPELTQQGTRVLTPDYAAPEQIAGLPVDTRSDVYASACCCSSC